MKRRCAALTLLLLAGCATTEPTPQAACQPSTNTVEDAAGRVADKAASAGMGAAGNTASRSARTATSNVYINSVGGAVVRATAQEIQRWWNTTGPLESCPPSARRTARRVTVGPR